MLAWQQSKGECCPFQTLLAEVWGLGRSTELWRSDLLPGWDLLGSLVQLVPKVTSSTELVTGLRYPPKHCHLHMCDCCQLQSQMRSIMSYVICSHLMKSYNTWWAGYLVWVQSGTSNMKHLWDLFMGFGHFPDQFYFLLTENLVNPGPLWE